MKACSGDRIIRSRYTSCQMFTLACSLPRDPLLYSETLEVHYKEKTSQVLSFGP